MEYRKSITSSLIVRLMPLQTRNAVGYHHIPNDTTYVIADNLEKHMEEYRKMVSEEAKKYAEEHVKPEAQFLEKLALAEKKIIQNVARFHVIDAWAHELTHQTLTRNSPIIKEDLASRKEDKSHGHTPLSLKSRLEIRKKHEEMTSRMKALDTINEGVAYYVTSQVTDIMGFHEFNERQDKILEKSRNQRGIDFLHKIKEIIGKNPVPLVAGHPPTSMQEIENPEEYLKAVREGRV